MGRRPALSTAKGPLPHVGLHNCHGCTRRFKKQSELDRHAAIHDGSKPHRCTSKGCGKSFAQKTALQTHSNTHTGARPHECRVVGCTSTFGDPSSRTRHEKETHDPSNGYQCHKCSHVCKRREQFRRHYEDCLKYPATDEHLDDARNLCKEAYAERVANGEIQEEPIAPPPKRKRRGAIAVISPSTPLEEYEEEDDMKQRQTPPRYQAYLGELSKESSATSGPNFYYDNSHLDEPAIGPSYTDTFETAYTSLHMDNYYAQPLHQYTPQGSSSPGHNIDHSTQLHRMGTPHYDMHDMGDHAMGHLDNRVRIPTTESFSTVHSSPAHAGHYSISAVHSPHLIHSPHVTSSTPPLLMPVASRQAVLFDQARDSPQLMYPQASYGAVNPTNRIPRSGLGVGHPQFQGRQYLQHHRHHPYARDRRGGIHSDAYTGSPSEAGLPMVDNSYGQNDPDSDSMPPLSLAGARAARPMLDSYEGSVPF